MLYGIQTTQTSWSTTTALLQEEVGNMLKKTQTQKPPLLLQPSLSTEIKYYTEPKIFN